MDITQSFDFNTSVTVGENFSFPLELKTNADISKGVYYSVYLFSTWLQMFRYTTSFLFVTTR